MRVIAAEVISVRGQLSAREAEQLKHAEADVEKGGRLIVAAMELIRDQKLYRATHDTFEDYCRERWSRTARDVNRLIQTEAVARQIGQALSKDGQEMGPIGPKISRAAAREVADLPVAEAVAVVKHAAQTTGKATAETVREAREQIAPKVDARKITGGVAFSVEELTDPPESPVFDALDRPVPKSLLRFHAAAAPINATAAKVDAIKRDATKLAEADGGQFIDMAEVNRLCRELKWCLSQARFYTTCPRCDGKGCDRCSQAGWLPHSKKGQLSEADKAALGVQ